MRLVIASLARRDLQAIARYSEKEWGCGAKGAVHGGCPRDSRCCSSAGSPRNDIASGYRSHPVGRHIIVYRVEERSVVILRVLHQRMDVRLHF